MKKQWKMMISLLLALALVIGAATAGMICRRFEPGGTGGGE